VIKKMQVFDIDLDVQSAVKRVVFFAWKDQRHCLTGLWLLGTHSAAEMDVAHQILKQLEF
jgi:hypothetical protein